MSSKTATSTSTFANKTKTNKDEIQSLINELKSKQAKTSKDKFELLDLRDRILKLARDDTQEQHGTCVDMCPEKERYRREYLGLLNTYEIRSVNEIDHKYLIKEYSRSSADQDLPLANELRPPDTLMYTINYLLNEIIPQVMSFTDTTDGNIVAEWYDFIWNRTRAIRKDITQQRLSDTLSVKIIEICARFHIYCSHRLCEYSSNIFDAKINDENLKNCFQSLIEYYDEATSASTATDTSTVTATTVTHENEPEFRAYMILMNLNDGNILHKIQRLKKQIQNSECVQYALRVFFAYNSRNYVKFFRLILNRKFEYLFSCLTHRYFVHVRHDAIRIMLNAYRHDNKKSFSLNKLVEVLCFDSEADGVAFCDEYNLDIQRDDGLNERFIIAVSRQIQIDRMAMERLRQHRSYCLIENKMANSNRTISQVIYGGGGEEMWRVLNCKQNSFDLNGSYIANDLPNMSGFEFLATDSASTRPAVSLPESKPQTKPFGFGLTAAAAETTATSNKFNKFLFKPAVPTAQPQQQATSLFQQQQPKPSPFQSALFQPKSQQQPQGPSNMFSELLSQAPKPEAQFPTIKQEIKRESQTDHILTDLTTNLINDYITDYLVNYFQSLKQTSMQIYEHLIQSQITLEVQQILREISLSDAFQRSFYETIQNECVIRMISNCLQNEINLNQTDLFKIDLTHQIYSSVYLDLYSNELNTIVNEIKMETERQQREQIAAQFYFHCIFDVHLYEILHEVIYEDTQLMLSVNQDLANDVHIACDCALLKVTFLKWKSKRQRQFNRIEILKTFLFKYVRCETYLLHVCWLPVNYKNALSNLALDQNLYFKILFVLPKLTNENCISRWLLTKFFQFDSNAKMYNMKYMYHLIKSLLRNNDLKFCVKACFNDMDDESYYEKKKEMRSLFGATAMIYVLMPCDGVDFKIYLNDNKMKFNRILRLINENLTVAELLNSTKFLFLSYLNNNEETRTAIEHLIPPAMTMTSQTRVIDYCLLNSYILNDNLIVENYFYNFLNKSSINSEMYSNLTITNFSNLLEMTVFKFFDYLSQINVPIPLEQVINEYNIRLDILTGIIAKDEYKKYTWPIPEHTDFTDAWTAKYWNTKEMIDYKLYEIRELLSLEIQWFSSLVDIQVFELKHSDNIVYNALNRVINQKLCQTEGAVEFIYEFKTKIQTVIDEIKSAGDELDDDCGEIKWHKILFEFVKYILTNGTIEFRTKTYEIDKFSIYANIDELKCVDWLNCGNMNLLGMHKRKSDASRRSKNSVSPRLNDLQTSSSPIVHYKPSPPPTTIAQKEFKADFQLKLDNFFRSTSEERLEFNSKFEQISEMVKNTSALNLTATTTTRKQKRSFASDDTVENAGTTARQDTKTNELNSKLMKLESLFENLDREHCELNKIDDRIFKSINNI